MSNPALFLSHGAPTLPLTETPARAFLEGLAATLDRPKAILVVSAHWETAQPAVNAVAVNDTIHDFRGFPEALYRLAYPAPGDPELAARIVARLSAEGFTPTVDTRRGLDHGAWVPLLLAWPEHDIPVLQLSVQPHLGPEHHLRLGQALKPLRDEGVLVIGSGAFTHNLREIDWRGGAEPEWSRAFAEWMGEALMENHMDDLLHYRGRAPYAARNHPTDEHLLPLYVALGAGDGPARRLHSSAEFGSLRMDAFAFG